MERFRNILLYAGSKSDNRTALRYAAALAKENDARLKVVDVIKEASHFPPILPSVNDLDLHDILRDERRMALDHLISGYREEGLDISAKVLSGITFIEIIREILTKEHDLLVTTAQGAGGLDEMLFGTTAMKLMRKCPCPVWAIKPSKEKRFGRIMAAVDFDPSHKESEELNAKIMELTVSLAESQKSELHIVHTWYLAGEATIRDSGDMLPVKAKELLQRIMERHSHWLEGLVLKYDPALSRENVHFLKGRPEELIPETAEKHRIDLIVMGTLGRTGVPGFFMGNTAEKVLQRVNCSVLAVKPDGFVSPVEIE